MAIHVKQNIVAHVLPPKTNGNATKINYTFIENEALAFFDRFVTISAAEPTNMDSTHYVSFEIN